MKKKSIILFFTLLCSFKVNAQIQWQKSLGGTFGENAYCIIQTFDSGYVVAGNSNSNNGDVTGNHGKYDYWIVKLNTSGVLQWQKSFGGTEDDVAHSVIQTYDSGYVIAGFSESNDGDVTGNHGNNDYWIVKLNASGVLQWQKSLGGTYQDYAASVIQTYDSGYVVAGFSYSNDGDVTGNHGSNDYWVVKLNASGVLLWQKSLGGTSTEWGRSVIQTFDSAFIIAGTSLSNDGDVTGNHGNYDYWVIKLDSIGNIQWQNSYGGTNWDDAYSIIQTYDSGYVFAGNSLSNDGDVSGNHGDRDYWIVKTNASGAITWQQSLGGTVDDRAFSIINTSDSGYVVAGNSASNNGDVTGNHGNADYWVVKLNASGAIGWQLSLGGTSGDVAYTVCKSYDNGYVVGGASASNDGDVTGYHGGLDSWIVKLGMATWIENLSNSNALHVYPNPSTHNFSIHSNSEFDNAQLNIFNSIGCNVYSEKLNGESKVIDTENFSSGIYYVQIIKGEKMWREKIIKE